MYLIWLGLRNLPSIFGLTYSYFVYSNCFTVLDIFNSTSNSHFGYTRIHRIFQKLLSFPPQFRSDFRCKIPPNILFIVLLSIPFPISIYPSSLIEEFCTFILPFSWINFCVRMTARSLRFPTILYSPTSRHRYVIRNIVLWRFKIMVFSRKRFFRGFFHGESKNVRFLLLHFLIYWLLLPTTYQSKCGVYDDVTDYMNVFEFSTSSENSTRNLHARTYTA